LRPCRASRPAFSQAAERGGGGISGEIDLQCRADEHVAGVMARRLAHGAIGAHGAVGAGEENIGPSADIGLHAKFGAKRMHALDKAGLDRRDQRRVRVERPMLADLAFQPERFRIGRQDQLDRRRIEADAVVQAIDAIFGVNSLDRHHGHQNLYFRDLGRIARKQRLDEMRLRALHDKVHPAAGNVHARQRIDDFVDLGDDNAALEGCRLDDDGRVLGVRAGVEIALPVCGLRADEADPRRQIDEIAAE
jgi:hypothetical protein